MVCDTDSDIKCRNVFLVTTCHVALQETDLYLHLTYRHQKFLQGKVSSSQTESFDSYSSAVIEYFPQPGTRLVWLICFLGLLVIKKLILRTTCQLWAVRN